MVAIHKKIWPEYFADIKSGKKKFELRLADFEVNPGDVLVLEEWDPKTRLYTGRTVEVIASYVLKTKDLAFFDQKDIEQHGYQIIQIEPKLEFPRGVEVVSSAIIRKGDTILLTRSPKWSNKWVFPGGHVDPGESILSAAVREAREETSLITKPGTVFYSGEVIKSPDYLRSAHIIYFDCEVEYVSGEVKLDVNELSEYVWISPYALTSYELASSYEDTIKAYLNYWRGEEMQNEKSS